MSPTTPGVRRGRRGSTAAARVPSRTCASSAARLASRRVEASAAPVSNSCLADRAGRRAATAGARPVPSSTSTSASRAGAAATRCCAPSPAASRDRSARSGAPARTRSPDLTKIFVTTPSTSRLDGRRVQRAHRRDEVGRLARSASCSSVTILTPAGGGRPPCLARLPRPRRRSGDCQAASAASGDEQRTDELEEHGCALDVEAMRPT